MTLFRDLRRLGAQLLAPLGVASVLLTACGGGTSQVSTFVPERLIIFGDENSVIVPDSSVDGTQDGFKYSINDRRATTPGKCLSAPNIAQFVAAQYGFVFAECNPARVSPTAYIAAIAGARVGDPATGLAFQLAKVRVLSGRDLGDKDLVTVMIGANDIIDLYEQARAGTLPGNDPVNAARELGRLAAQQVSAILATGARALVMTVPDLSLSPYALARTAGDPDARALLASMSYEYNGSLRTGITPNDGRYYGLVLADDIVAAMFNEPSTYLAAPSIAQAAACTTATALTYQCQLTNDAATTTLVPGASLTSHLWASDRHLGPEAMRIIGQQAQARAVNNPF